jgi:hypothetical protein
MSHKISIAIIASILSLSSFAQVSVVRNQTAPLSKVLDFKSLIQDDWDPTITVIKEMPKPASDFGNKKAFLEQKRSTAIPSKASQRSQKPDGPLMGTNFTANTSQGVPNDNDIAISDAGKIISVVNTNLRVYSDTGTMQLALSLAQFANSLGSFQVISDPRVSYDPVADRFILMFFSGVTSATTEIIVAFSQTNNPEGAWNFYALSGNYLNDSTWSDYPIISITDKDLFITFNHLKDGEGWQTGFRYSVIWQIDKQDGYDGDTLSFNFWHDIKYQGVPIWNVCPVQSDYPSGNVSYFLSVRPSAFDNDTVFLHKISDSYVSGNAQFSTQVLKSNISYGLSPNAYQADGQRLATNDARVLTAVIQNGKIHYGQNSIDPGNLSSGLYIGKISNLNNQPSVSAQIISSDTIDFGYPDITTIGNGNFDDRVLITASYITRNGFPGTAVFYKNTYSEISEMTVVKEGFRYVNVLGDSLERWGDYTGIQRRYNEPNVAWLSGSYTHTNNQYRTWIAKVYNSDSSYINSINETEKSFAANLFPIPAQDQISFRFENEQLRKIRFEVFDINGRLIRTLLDDHIKPGLNEFAFSAANLSNGQYFLILTSEAKYIHKHRFVINR